MPCSPLRIYFKERSAHPGFDAHTFKYSRVLPDCNCNKEEASPSPFIAACNIGEYLVSLSFRKLSYIAVEFQLKFSKQGPTCFIQVM